jgi:hypothetical protein
VCARARTRACKTCSLTSGKKYRL